MSNIMIRPISSHPNYSITSDGRVLNSKNKEKAIHKSRDGYYKVNLYTNGHSTSKRVNRLVAEAFIPNPNNKPDVNHKDGNKLNNSYENLEWATRSENMRHAYDMGLAKPHASYGMRGHKNPNGGRKRRPVEVIETGDIFPSILECAKALGIDERRVYECVKGTRDSYQGHHFVLV